MLVVPPQWRSEARGPRSGQMQSSPALSAPATTTSTLAVLRRHTREDRLPIRLTLYDAGSTSTATESVKVTCTMSPRFRSRMKLCISGVFT